MEYFRCKYFLINISLWWLVKSSDISNKLNFTSSNCKLVEPIYNFTFDFNPLHSDFAHIIKTEKGDIFEFNVCGNLTKTCSGHTNVAACLTTTNGEQHVLGINQKLAYRNGRIYFRFENGEECKPGKNYLLNVLVSCDYTLDTKLFSIMPYASDECTFYILWETPYACLPEPDYVKSNACIVEDKKTGHTYNLLQLSESNYRTIDQNSTFFVINVCKPVLYGQNSMCPPGSSVCFVDLKSKDIRKMFLNYGTVQSKPIIENGQVLMRHESDTICNSTHNITSTIYFVCDPHVKYGEPNLIRRKGCEYIFKWETSVVCEKTKPCTVINSNTGFEYDFSSLSHKKYVTKSKDGKTYTLGICSDPGNPCLEHSGICEQNSNNQSTSLGLTNDHLNFNLTGAPYLLYESGSICHDNVYWSTKIEFLCNSNNNSINNNQESNNENNSLKRNEIKVIENSNCRILIQFQTQLACQKEISCKAKGYTTDDEIDITPLISTTTNYVALVDKKLKLKNKNVKFFLNVCRPLIPEYGLGCSGGTAACKTVMGSKTPEQEQSLGYPDVSLTIIDKSRAILKYLRGDQCPEDATMQLSSSIEFYCDYHAGKGLPILESIADKCHYLFNWPTSVICPPNLCKFNNNNCELINDRLNEIYNIKNTNFISNGKLTIKEDLKVVDICNDVTERKVIADYVHSTVKIQFNTKIPCENDGTLNVELRLVCSINEHRSSSNDNALCNIVIIQETSSICKFLGINVTKLNENHHSETTSTTDDITKTSTTTTQNPPPTFNSNKIQTTTTTTTTMTTTINANDKISTTTQKAAIITTDHTTNNDNNSNDKVLTTAGIILTLLTILLMACFWWLKDKTRRKKIKRWFRRDTPRVQYSRVETNEEANVLLLQEGHITDSDEDILT